MTSWQSNKDARTLAWAFIVSTIGERLSFGAALIHMSMLWGKHGPLIVLSIWSLGFVLAYPFANRALARYSLFQVQFFGDIARGLLVIGYVSAFFSGPELSRILIPFLMLLVVFLTATTRPAVWSSVPLLLNGDQCRQFNRFLVVTGSVALAVGSAVGGLLANTATPVFIYLADAVTYFVSAALVAAPSLKKKLHESAPKQIRPSLVMFVLTLKGSRELKSLFMVSFSVTVLVGIFSGSMVTSLVSQFDLDKSWIGYLYGISAASNIFGGYIQDLFFRNRSIVLTNRLNAAFAILAVLSTAVLLFGFSFPISLLMLFAASALSTHTSIWTGSQMMHECPSEKRAVWSSSNMAVARLCMFIGSIMSPIFTSSVGIFMLSILCIFIITRAIKNLNPTPYEVANV
jgi:uncharacterized membrane protein YeiH